MQHSMFNELCPYSVKEVTEGKKQYMRSMVNAMNMENKIGRNFYIHFCQKGLSQSPEFC